MNIILKAFDGEYCKEILEHTFRGVKLGTVINIANHQKQWPNLDAKEHLWIPAEPQRAGQYQGVSWPELTPLDEELIEAMRPCEAVFFMMIERYARYREISYVDRRQQYFDHLRYWHHILTTKRIDLLLMNTEPHQCYDWVLYHLCKLKGIPIWYIERCYIVDAFYLVRNLEESAVELQKKVTELQEQYRDPSVTIPLSPRYEDYFRSHTQENADPWYMYRRSEHMKKKSFILKWSGKAMEMMWHKPNRLLSSMISPEFWHRKLRQHRTMVLYDRLAQEPDLSKPFLYVPLHLQPEATTCPMSGAYMDQERLVQLLAWHLPADVRLYVKEHPAQEELCRSEAFYRHLQELPSVTLVPRDFDTFALTDHALAVATGTGTAGFEALFRGKPVLMFGHRFYQYAPGVYRIHSNADCTTALTNIMKGEKPSERDARLFLKAIEETGTPYVGGPANSHEQRTKEEKAKTMGTKIRERLQQSFTT